MSEAIVSEKKQERRMGSGVSDCPFEQFGASLENMLLALSTPQGNPWTIGQRINSNGSVSDSKNGARMSI